MSLAPAADLGGAEPAEVTVETSFWVRPYSRPTVVLNPDRLAVVVLQTAVYATPAQSSPPEVVRTGQVKHEFRRRPTSRSSRSPAR